MYVSSRKTYRIEMSTPYDPNWRSCGWSYLSKSKAEGALMALDAFYGTTDSYRIVCEQTKEVTHTIFPRKAPAVPDNLSDTWVAISSWAANMFWLEAGNVIKYLCSAYYHSGKEAIVAVAYKDIPQEEWKYLNSMTPYVVSLSSGKMDIPVIFCKGDRKNEHIRE